MQSRGPFPDRSLPLPPDDLDGLAVEDLVGDEQSRVRLALRAGGVGVWSYLGGVLTWNDAMLRLFDVDQQPADYAEYLALLHPKDRDAVHRDIQGAMRGAGYRDVEHRVVRHDGSIRWILGRGLTIRRTDGTVAGLVGVSIDITAFKRTEDALWRAKQEAEALTRRLRDLSATDGLTGIANRRRLDEHLDIEWRRAARTGLSLALVICDIDNFKDFNDHYGHLAGDDCLRRIAATLDDRSRRATDLVGRYGGEEFLLVMSATDADEALAQAEHLRRAVAALAIPHTSSGEGTVTVSCGVAVARPTVEGNKDELIAAADLALYEAKARGRDQVCVYPPAAPAA